MDSTVEIQLESLLPYAPEGPSLGVKQPQNQVLALLLPGSPQRL